MSAGSATNGEVVDSPFSILSEEDVFLLGTPAASTQTYPSLGQYSTGSMTDDEGWDGTVRQDKGKGRDRSGDEDVAMGSRREGQVPVGANHSEHGTSASVTSNVSADASPASIRKPAHSTPVSSERRPAPIHSFTYAATTSHIRLADVASDHLSGRSTPIVAESAPLSSIQSKFSTMRVKMKRKGSALIDGLGKGKDVDRIAGRCRSGTTSSIATSVSLIGNDQSPSSLSTAEASRNSSRVNLRTRLADKFDLSPRAPSDSRPLRFFGRNKSSTSAPAMTADSTVQAPSSSRVMNRPPVQTQASTAGVQADGDAGQYDYFSPSPVSAKPNTVHLGSTSVVLPLMSPISPSMAFTTTALTPPDANEELDTRIKSTADGMKMEVVESRQTSSFDSKLPRELQLQCLATLIDLHAAEHAKAIRRAQRHPGEGKERAIHYLENRWVGKMAGRRELFKISRVRTPPLYWCNLLRVSSHRCLERGESSPLTVSCGKIQTSTRQSGICLRRR